MTYEGQIPLRKFALKYPLQLVAAPVPAMAGAQAVAQLIGSLMAYTRLVAASNVLGGL